MKKFLLFICLGFLSFSGKALDLKTGDILLQPLKCWSCELIKAQENSDFAHIGVFIREQNTAFVIEAYGKVKKTALKEFLQRTQGGSQVLVRRSSALKTKEERAQLKKQLLSYLGHEYDEMFLWDNFSHGKEKLYCSELVYKAFLKLGFLTKLKPKSMDFDINPKLWDQFFKGKTPRGKLGISPEDFYQSSEFFDIGYLD